MIRQRTKSGQELTIVRQSTKSCAMYRGDKGHMTLDLVEGSAGCWGKAKPCVIMEMRNTGDSKVSKHSRDEEEHLS